MRESERRLIMILNLVTWGLGGNILSPLWIAVTFWHPSFKKGDVVLLNS